MSNSLFNRINGLLSIIKFHLTTLNCRYSHSCLALFYLRQELQRNIPGCETSINQLTINDPYYDTLLRLSEDNNSIIFFSVYIWNHAYIKRLITDIVRIDPKRSIILGGPQATIMHNQTHGCTLVQGEIEGVGESFYTDLQQGSLKPFYKAKPGNTFSSPYQDGDFSKHLANRYIYYESSRGCPFSCSYCLSSTSRGAIHSDLARVKKDIEVILAHNPQIIKFVDRTFNDTPARALAIWNYLAELQTQTKFHFEIAPDRFTEEMMHFLETVEPDLFQFEIGIQSTNEKTLSAINRRMDVTSALNNIRRLALLNTIHLHVDLILGLPHEDLDGFRNSFNMVFAQRPHHIQMGLLKVLPNTPMRNQTEAYGMIHCTEPPYEVLATRWLSHPELSRLHHFSECIESFYNTRFFSSLWCYLAKKKEEPFLFFTDLLQTCSDTDFFNRARTQKLLTKILYKHISTRPDSDLLHELLCYDWLRCGYRFLPDYFQTSTKEINATRDLLRKNLPQNLPTYFDYATREEFFKNGIFLTLSGDALAELSLSTSGEQSHLCFLPQQTTGAMKHHKVVLLPQYYGKTG